MSWRSRPAGLVLIQEADRSAKLQAQLPDALGAIESQEGSLEARAGPDHSQQREIFGKTSWDPRETHICGVKGKKSHKPLPFRFQVSDTTHDLAQLSLLHPVVHTWEELAGGCAQLSRSGHSVGHISWTDASCPPDTIREGREPQGPEYIHRGCTWESP